MADKGRPSKYKPEYDKRIVELAKTKEGRHMYRIASIFGVCHDTMLEWCEVYPTFSEAYAQGASEQKSRLLDLVEEHILNRDLNQTGINLLFRHAGGFAEQRALRIKNISKGTHSDKVQAVLEFCERVGMAPDEFQKSITALGTIAKIDEVTELRKMVEDLEEKE